MIASGFQHTLRTSAKVSGFGYWSGQDIDVEFHPASADTGIVFVRSDAANARLPLSVANRIDMPRRTTLAVGDVRVEMVEHIAAALAGLGIDNCEVRVDGIEMPGLDGSAAGFVDAIDAAGVLQQAASRQPLYITQAIRVGDEQAWIEAEPADDGQLTLEYRLDYGEGNAIGRQTLRRTISPELVRTELAPARTFLFKHEADWLRSQGLGGRVTTSDLLIFDEQGPIDNPLRFEDECVRHKMLDLVGDLSLAGRPIVGRVTAYRTGHQRNAELVRQLLAAESQLPARRLTA
ncbi:MAG: UDP-3-O-[3-hydroxymyristoyl] N-acetylglucosamine deacetylase [Planctomycetales bacterium]|nr:UDP-3-O-[3-hydroxymyristoyl] N-acetylglucosamine deacetylase [Planctomycetales bacterium]